MHKYLGLVGMALLLAGCGATGGAAEPAEPWHDGIGPAASGGKVGGADSACPLPVAIDVAGKWNPKPVDTGEDNEGGLDLACEIDAKPAGAIGFVRVWVGGAAEPRQALEGFVAEQKASDPVYRDASIGPGTGVEVTWRSQDTGRKRAFAMSTPVSTVVVTVGGIDDQEYRQLLPAYLLARQSLVPLQR